MSRAQLTDAVYATLRANDMTDGVHVRLMVTRGVKSTPYQDPRVTIGPATVVIVAEHKEPSSATVTEGITLFTTHVRRATPDTLDPKLNAHSKLNDIQACIQAYTAGADEALMLDPHGFVATCNSTHFFIVRKGEVWTSTGDYCLGGITRGLALEVAREAGIPAFEKDFSLTDVYGAPLRLRIDNQLGFKMVKWIERIEFVESIESLGDGEGGSGEDDDMYDLLPNI